MPRATRLVSIAFPALLAEALLIVQDLRLELFPLLLVRDFLLENAKVTIYDPEVPHEQIWLDLSEALPNWPIEKSKPLFC